MTQITRRETAFTTPWFDLVAKTVEGDGAPFYSIRTLDYVSVIAVTPTDEVLLVRQYRAAIERPSLELPSGHVDPGETPEEAARRELLEETGYEAGSMQCLGCMASDTGRLDNRLWAFAATALRAPGPSFSVEAGIEVLRCTRQELLAHVRRGTFDHALNVAVLMLASLRFGPDLVGLAPNDHANSSG